MSGTYKATTLTAELARVLVCAVAMLLSGIGGAWDMAHALQPPVGDHALNGVVRDDGGKPVAGATIRLVSKSDGRAMETTSAADGAFEFATAPLGPILLSAHKGAMHSGDVDVEASDPRRGGGAAGLVLTLSGGSSALAAQPMEFSDSPSFTIAAVTDWTAAGGHGSDAILRTSESLNREVWQLKGQDPAVSVAVADPAMKQAMALTDAGNFAGARRIASDELAKKPIAEWLRFAGELDEKLGDPVSAVNEFERAVHEDGSEPNYFAWGSELLRHRAIWQAKDVFTAGAQRYPKSARMLTAQGAALFACALYDDAAQKLCEAANLKPDSQEAYIFLGKAELASPNPLHCSEEKLAEFAQRQPENPLASYYDAMAMWKHDGRSTDPEVMAKVEALLKRAVTLDAKCSDAYLQLGNLNASRREIAAAIEDYKKAIESNPDLADAHYRLGLAYDRAGDKEGAAREFAIHERLDKQQAAEVERERREVKQFLVQSSGVSPANP